MTFDYFIKRYNRLNAKLENYAILNDLVMCQSTYGSICELCFLAYDFEVIDCEEYKIYLIQSKGLFKKVIKD